MPRLSLPSVALALAALCSLALAVVMFGQGGVDDTYITYWPAQTLAEHGEILNYNGKRLEQSSSLSLVIVLAFLYCVTPWSMPTLGYVVSLAGGLCTLLLAVRVAERAGLTSRCSLVLSIGTVCFGYWATSGMETTLVTASALWLIHEWSAPEVCPSAGISARLALAALIFACARPETPIVLVGLAATRVASVFAERRTARRAAPWVRVVIVLGAAGFPFAFRRLYFAAWWPNPAVMKSGGFDAEGGSRYLWDALTGIGWLPATSFLVGLGVIVARRLRGSVNAASELIVALALAQLGFVIFSGGDWMPGARFLAPVIPALVLCQFIALEAFAGMSGRRGLASIVLLSNFAMTVQALHRGDTQGQPMWTLGNELAWFRDRVKPYRFAPVEVLNKIHRHDVVLASELLPIVEGAVALNPSRPVYLMSGQAGPAIYHVVRQHFRKVFFLDLWALTMRDVFDCLPAGTVARGVLGAAIGTWRPFRESKQLQDRCGIPLPDIYFNPVLEPHSLSFFEEFGYVLVYQQTGAMRHAKGPTFFPSTTQASGLIAVKRELAEALKLEAQPVWRWEH